ncbi:MAG: VCBS repeat-containing protein [Verrucomicrobia bacterium]|nr:VCBS repeat-containing protein [Verrucomicrobiota bacterium]
MLALSGGCDPKSPAPRSLNGQALAEIACARCHPSPSPSFLPREEWPYLLAWMGNYLGYSAPPDIELHPLLVDRTLVPPKPLVTREEFDAIRAYFLDRASGQYQEPELKPKPAASPLFEPLPFAIPASVITLAWIDPSDQTLVIGSSRPAEFRILERGQTTAIEVHSEPIAYERVGPVRRVALMGHFGRDFRLGRIVDFGLREGIQQTVVDNHARITAHRTADLDGDGKDDLFVCGFGDYPVGRVGLWWGGGETLQENVLFEEPGSTWGDVADFDGDGDLDVMIAVANARPRLLAFVNEGPRRFVPRVIVGRPVGWGYNRCLIVDWDNDGKPDLVELAGNNLELRGRPLKAHYGVRVLRNEGDWKFAEVLFERLDGAMDVAAGDFDGNGRIDLAATAFYPDWRSTIPTTFLLLMQRTDGTVERAGLEDRYWNRWIRVGAGDADGDGDTDLILGAAQVPMAIPAEHLARYEEFLKEKASVLLLRNRSVP